MSYSYSFDRDSREEESYYSDPDETEFVVCPRCKGSGIDPSASKSYQEDEYDCSNCWGDGEIPVL